MFKPSFTGVKISGGDGDKVVTVSGRTAVEIESGGLADIIDITVVLVQGERVARTSVLAPIAGFGFKLDEGWDATLPGEGGAQPDFTPGAAVAFGVETRIENRTTIIWSEDVTIAPS